MIFSAHDSGKILFAGVVLYIFVYLTMTIAHIKKKLLEKSFVPIG